MLCLLAKTMCGRTQLTMPRADPEEGAWVRTPAPRKITNYIGLYRKMQLDPPPPAKSWTPWKCWTVLLHGISESYSLKTVFFEKAMITGLPLQNKLRTNKKKEEKKKTRQSFFSVSRAWTPPPPPPPTAKPRRNVYTLSWW